MGRPTKPGLDFFRHDVGLLSDPKLRAPRQEFGYLATIVYMELLEMIYRDKGYYLEYGGEARSGVIWAMISEALLGKYVPSDETVANVIDRLTACGLFSDDLYKRGFITSKRIQEHYYFATTGRTDPAVRWDLWLLSEPEMRAIGARNVLLQKFISREENHSFTREKLPLTECESTQSKVKNSKEKNSISTLVAQSEIEQILETKLNRNNCAAVQAMQDAGMTDAVLRRTAEYAHKNAKGDQVAYFMTVLRGRWKDGILSEADLDAAHPSRGRQETGGHEPTGELQDWEKEQMEKVADYMRRKEEEDTDGTKNWGRAAEGDTGRKGTR